MRQNTLFLSKTRLQYCRLYFVAVPSCSDAMLTCAAAQSIDHAVWHWSTTQHHVLPVLRHSGLYALLQDHEERHMADNLCNKQQQQQQQQLKQQR